MKYRKDFLNFINNNQIVSRNRINEKINKLLEFNKILYIYSKIGWGKTTAIMDYGIKNPNGLIYCEFEKKDNEPNNFINTLTKIIDLGEYKNINKKTIILDNMNLITNEFVANLIVHFITLTPDDYKFIIIGTKKLPIFFGKLAVERKIEVLNGEILAFNISEINEFYSRENIHLKKEEIKEIFENTGGWPSGLSSILFYLKLNRDTNIKEILKDNQYITDFLDKTLWVNIDEKNREIITEIGLFKELSIEEAIKILGADNYKEVINDFLEIKKDGTYKLIHIFRRYINKKGELLPENKKNDLYKKAGEYFEKKNYYLKAAKYYRQASYIKGEIRNLEKSVKKEVRISKVKLTKSEMQILELIHKGMTNIEVGEYLNIKKDTVKFHIKNIYSKLNVKNRVQAIKAAQELGIM